MNHHENDCWAWESGLEIREETGQLYHDGKKIYQKTIVFGTMPNTTTKTVAHNITGLGYVLQMWGVADNGTSQLPISYVVTSAVARRAQPAEKRGSSSTASRSMPIASRVSRRSYRSRRSLARRYSS